MCPDKVNMASWYFSDLLRVVRYFGICTVPIFWQLSLSGVRELSRWPLWYTEGGGKFDMKVVPCPKKSYMEVKKSDMEVAPFSLIKALSTFLHRPYFHLFLTQLRYGVACFLTPPPLLFSILHRPLIWRHLFLHWTSTGLIKPFYTRHFANFIRITLEL